jgi:hypothetical protein
MRILGSLIPLLLLTFHNVCAKELEFLSPPNYSPYFTEIIEYSGFETLDLNGEWHYQVGAEGSKAIVQIPSSWQNFTGKVKFRRNFRIDSAYQGGYFRLLGMGISRRCSIFLNGEVVGLFEGPQIEVVLPEKLLVYDRNNVLEIEVDNRLEPLKTIPLRNGILAPYNYGGITGDIFLTMEKLPAIGDLKASVNLSPRSDSGIVSLEGKFIKPAGMRILPFLHCQITDFSGKIAVSVVKDYGETESFYFKVVIPRPLLWSPSDPKLYRLDLWFESSEGRYTVHCKQLGFLKFKADEDFRLNNSKILLRGLTYYPEYQCGLTFGAGQYLSDLKAIRECGANALLLPTLVSPYLLQLCDSLGMLVFQASGIEGAPNGLFNNEAFTALAVERIRQMVLIGDSHPSLVGWIIGRKMTPGFESKALLLKIPEEDYRPIFLEIAQQPSSLYKFELGSIDSSTKIITDLSAVVCQGGITSETHQLDEIFRKLQLYKGAPGIFLGTFADWRTEGGILYQGDCQEKGFFLGGLVKQDRQTRLIYRTLQQGWFSHSPKKSSPTSDTQSFEFPIVGLVILGMILLYIRSNKVFRLKLKRTFAHSHGFFQDIRNGRFIGKFQTAFVGLISAVVMAVIFASIFYHYRYSPAFDYLLRHIFMTNGLNPGIIHIVWRPLLAILYLFALVVLSYIIFTVVFQVSALLLRKSLPFGQAFVFILWSWSCFIWFSPITLLFYRAMEITAFKSLIMIAFLFFFLWGYIRCVNALKVVSTGGFFRAFLALSAMCLLFWGSLALFLQSQCGLFNYWDYFFQAVI